MKTIWKMKNQIGIVKSFEKRQDIRNEKAVDWLTFVHLNYFLVQFMPGMIW